ncbi:asparagine synthase (glutamine-hydrolyzing) [Desulfogranum marinum]|uniref:asparagine synthase (glutamine-hydrolyzing) n=1 Tax=Desulfogranum marinum TaxID=453220 RepID=UPI001962C7D4|nr:asparagine synthase (glutamine-hydrolyzing) [Desulfogranum marinum]MBM9514556.1 asparagine synthase (glutamine-hydrolyzing) [Desulfogranum marinum]
MCGIAGFYTIAGHDTASSNSRIRKMTDSIQHRGPDEEGYYVDDNIALGHRRLSIIDLASGQQPMAIAEGRFQIVFNGEIYNFQEIRQELKKRGCSFSTNSDTEVILHSYRQWGEECVNRFNGMFAFAIWDKAEKTLFLARDRVGKKPLYYFWDGSFFSFASELKAVSIENDKTRDIDCQALDCYFSFGYIPSPKTVFKNVAKLEPAHTLTVNASGLTKKQYWHLRLAPDNSLTLDTATERFEELLDDATRMRLVSEVPLGAFLSGGIDSTLVVSSMAKMSNKPVLTNTIGFTGFADETRLAKGVADAFQADHREFSLTPDCAEILPQIAHHFDEPFADSSAVPTWYVCQMARKNVTVVLSGDGGDESFGGYTFRYLPHMFESRIRKAVPVALRSLLFGPLGTNWPASAKLSKPLRLKTIFENLSISDVEAYYNDLIWLRSDMRQKLYSEAFHKHLRGYTPFEAVAPLYSGEVAAHLEQQELITPLMRAQYADVNFYMTEDVLVKVDRMSMAHSLEVRSPLLDYRILEFAAILPDHLKIDNQKGKVVLRNLAAKRLPKEILKQPKSGFAAPIAKWLRTDLKEMMESSLSRGDGLVSELFSKNVLDDMWREHTLEKRDHSVFLWAVLMLDMWEKHALK